MDADVAPCPECRQPIALAARVCPHCRRSVLADVAVQSALRDARARYRAARALAALGDGVLPLGELQNRLAAGQGLIAAGVPRDLAERAAAVVRESGAAAAVVRSSGGAAVEAPSGAGVGRGLVWLLAGALVIALGAGAALYSRRGETAGRRSSAAAGALSPAEVAARGLPAAVALTCGEQSGSGFFVAQDLLLTNAHVVCPGDPSVTVRFNDGREERGTVEAADAAFDLAVVRSAGLRSAPLPLGDAGALRVGDRLTMIGSPLGLDFSVAQCGVGNLDRHDLGLAFVQIDALRARRRGSNATASRATCTTATRRSCSPTAPPRSSPAPSTSSWKKLTRMPTASASAADLRFDS